MSKDTNYYKSLQELSKEAAARRSEKVKQAKSEKEAKYWATKRINWFLLNEVYDTGEASEFKTCEEWNFDNCTVKRDSRPFVIWGQKTENDKYFPLVFLFSDLQVLFPIDCREVEEPEEPQENEFATTVDLESDLM